MAKAGRERQIPWGWQRELPKRVPGNEPRSSIRMTSGLNHSAIAPAWKTVSTLGSKQSTIISTWLVLLESGFMLPYFHTGLKLENNLTTCEASKL